MTTEKPVRIIEVWDHNLEDVFIRIRRAVRRFRFACFDTEFPGTIYPYKLMMNSESNYWWMKQNIDAMKIIQIGLTLSDEEGNLLDFDTDSCLIWQFNFRDFNVHEDKNQNEDSIKLLERNGIDFEDNIKKGIDSRKFAGFLLRSGLLMNCSITWITFQGSYDFGLLLKILTNGKQLPQKLDEFMKKVRFFFGSNFYDVKYLLRFCRRERLYGGLDKIANKLQVRRLVGKSHQAGSDSLLTLHTFQQLVNDCWEELVEIAIPERGYVRFRGASVLYGLDEPPPPSSMLLCFEAASSSRLFQSTL